MDMRKVCHFLFLWAFLLTSCTNSGGAVQDSSQEPEEKPADQDSQTPASAVFQGTFLQHWITVRWDDARWDAEMAVLKEAGLPYLIYTPVKDGDAAADYTSLERCLKSAQKQGIKVFVGPNHHEDWWSKGRQSSWLTARMQEGNEIVSQIVSRFGTSYSGTLHGWYWDWEIDNANWNTADAKSVLVQALNTTLDALPEGMPLLFSPFANPTLGSAADYGKFWKELLPQVHFRSGDILAPQDGVGASGLAVSGLKGWFYQYKQAVESVQGLQLWGNVETFCQYSFSWQNYFASAPFGRVIDQIKALTPYVQQVICFAYPHYFSPNQVSEKYHAAYKEYVKSGTIPTCPVPKAVSSATKEVGTGVALNWALPTRDNADGFAIYKNGSVYVKLQVTPGLFPGSFFDYNGKSSDTYQIATYNFLGEESAKVSF